MGGKGAKNFWMLPVTVKFNKDMYQICGGGGGVNHFSLLFSIERICP